MEKLRRYWLVKGIFFAAGVLLVFVCNVEAAWISSGVFSAANPQIDIKLIPDSIEEILGMNLELNFDTNNADFNQITNAQTITDSKVTYASEVSGVLKTVTILKYEDIANMGTGELLDKTEFERRAKVVLPKGKNFNISFNNVTKSQFLKITKATGVWCDIGSVDKKVISVPIYLRADFDKSGLVSGSDFTRFCFKFAGGTSDPIYDTLCDLNDDGKINTLDFTYFLTYWQQELK